MTCNDGWENAARELGSVVRHFLDEFEEMCRGSEHKIEALAALTTLSDLEDEQGRATRD